MSTGQKDTTQPQQPQPTTSKSTTSRTATSKTRAQTKQLVETISVGVATNVESTDPETEGTSGEDDPGAKTVPPESGAQPTQQQAIVVQQARNPSGDATKLARRVLIQQAAATQRETEMYHSGGATHLHARSHYPRVQTVSETESEVIAMIARLSSELDDMRREVRRLREIDGEARSVRRESLTSNPGGATETRAYDLAGRDADVLNETRAVETAMVPFQARLPRSGWIKNPFDELSYRGKGDRQNPIKFLQKFERLAEYERVSAEDQLFYFGRCMRGPASQ